MEDFTAPFQTRHSPSANTSRSFKQDFSRVDTIRLHGYRQKRALHRDILKSVEIKYLQYASSGNVQAVKNLFTTYDRAQLNRNCTDYFQRTALVLAIMSRQKGMIKYLLENEVELTESLFYAVEIEYAEAVEIIVSSDAPRYISHKDIVITSEESVFPRFLSPIMLAAHKNNYEILDILYSHGHRLVDLSKHTSNKWDEMRLRWLFYKAYSSQAYLVLMYYKSKIDPLNEAIELYGKLKNEGRNARETMKDAYLELLRQCEDFAISLLDQLRTAQEVADLLRFRLFDPNLHKTGQLACSVITTVAGNSDDERDGIFSFLNINNKNGSLDSTASGLGSKPRTNVHPRMQDLGKAKTVTSSQEQSPAQIVRAFTGNSEMNSMQLRSSSTTSPQVGGNNPDANSSPYLAASVSSDQRRISSAIENVPEGRHRSLGIRRPVTNEVDMEYVRPKDFLKPIEKAVDNGMVRLVTSQNVQFALSYLKEGTLFRDSSHKRRWALNCLIATMFPFISVVFYFFPTTKIGLVARNPKAKLTMEVSSDVCLILLLLVNMVLTEFQIVNVNDFSYLLIVAYFWMLGKLNNMIFLFYHQGWRVLYSIWNWNDIGSIVFYTAYMVLHIYEYVERSSLTREELEGYQWSPIPLADIMITVVYVLVFLRPLEMLRVSRIFGPLQVSLDRMMQDVSKVFVIFLFIWFAFSSGITTLFARYHIPSVNQSYTGSSICQSKLQHNDDHQDDTADWNNFTCCFTDQKLSNLGSSLQILFWSIFGYSDNYMSWFNLRCTHEDRIQREITTTFGEVIFAFYHIGIVLVLVNMLIAIMSGTLQKTVDQNDQQWQFHRMRVWFRFIRTGFYRPPPMNIILRPGEIKFVFHVIGNGFRILCGYLSSRCRRKRRYQSSEQYEMHHTQLVAGRNLSGIGNNTDIKKITKSNPYQSTGQRISYDNYAVEEPVSRYNIALQKVVKRYLKVNVLLTEGENTHDGDH